MDKIWEPGGAYRFWRKYVDGITRSSFSNLTVKGLENIPDDAQVLISPNHCNTLMDALVILQSFKHEIAFGARFDMFRKPTAAKALRWLRILPFARQRDGMDAVSHNYEVFDEVVDCLAHNVPFCLFPEGTHRAKRSLLPLKNGIFKIAKLAVEKNGKPVYIVPAGIEYSDYYKYMSNCTVSFGEPIEVTADSEIPELKETLRQRMSELITYFPDDENYDTAYAHWCEMHKRNRRWWHWLFGLAALPVFAVAAGLALPIWVISAIVGGKMKDKAWLNTVHYGVRLLLMLPLTIAIGVPAFINLPWTSALCLILMFWLSGGIFYRLLNYYRFLFNK